MKGNTKGFTLIELVIAIAILGILAGIAIPRFLDAQASARGSKLIGDMRTIDSACGLYATRVGAYPTKMEELIGGENGPGLLAAIPVPPASESSLRITQNSGTVRDFVASGTEYTIVNGRAAYTCSTDKDRTIEFYLGQESTTPEGGGESSGEGSGETPSVTRPTTGIIQISEENWNKLTDKLKAFFADGWNTRTTTDGDIYAYKKNTSGEVFVAVLTKKSTDHGHIKKDVVSVLGVDEDSIKITNNGKIQPNMISKIDPASKGRIEYEMSSSGVITITDVDLK